MLSVKSTVKPKKIRTAVVTSLSPVQTADMMEESCDVSDYQPQQNAELQNGKTAHREIMENKPLLSEMDSGILMEEVEDESAVGEAVRRKRSSQGASSKQKSSITQLKPSETDSISGNLDAQTSCVKFTTVGSHGNVETLQEKSSDHSSRVHMMSNCQMATSWSEVTNWAPEFEDSGVKELSAAKVRLGSVQKEMKSVQSRKKFTRKEVDTQQKFTASSSRRHSSSEIEHSDGDEIEHSDGADGGNDDDHIVINSLSDDDEPSVASNQMTPNHPPIDAGIVVLSSWKFMSFSVVNYLHILTNCSHYQTIRHKYDYQYSDLFNIFQVIPKKIPDFIH